MLGQNVLQEYLVLNELDDIESVPHHGDEDGRVGVIVGCKYRPCPFSMVLGT